MTAEMVFARLLALAPNWRSADPYLLRHAARHAALAGRLPDLLSDHEFLVHADPGALVDELAGSSLPDQMPSVADYLSTLDLHRGADPGKRAQILAVAAAARGDHQRSEMLLSGRGWRPAAVYDFPGAALVGTDGEAVAASGSDGFLRLLPYRDHEQFVVARHDPHEALAVAGTVLVTGGTTIMATDLATGQTRQFDGGSGHWYTSLAVDRRPDRTLLIATVRVDRQAEIWDLTAGEQVGTIALDHGERLGAVACARIGDRRVAVLVSKDGRGYVVDLETTRPIRAIPSVARDTREGTDYYLGDLTFADCAEVDGEPLAVLAAKSNIAGVWNIGTGEQIGEFRHSEESPIAGLRCLRFGGVDVVATIAFDQTIRVFDLRTLRILEVIELGAEPRAVSGSGATLLTIAGDRVHRIDISHLSRGRWDGNGPADRM